MTTRSLLLRLRRLEARQPEAKRVWVVAVAEGQEQETALAAVLQGREIRPDDAVVYYSREGVDCFAVLERDPSLADRIYANDGGSLRWIDIIFQAIEASPLSRLDAHIKT